MSVQSIREKCVPSERRKEKKELQERDESASLRFVTQETVGNVERRREFANERGRDGERVGGAQRSKYRAVGERKSLT